MHYLYIGARTVFIMHNNVISIVFSFKELIKLRKNQIDR